MTKRKFLTGGIATLTALAIGSTAFAGTGGDYGHKASKRDGKRMERMLDKVDATDAQRAEIQAVLDEFKPQRKALGEQLRAAKRTLHQADPTAPGYAALADEQAQVIGQLTADKIRMQSDSRGRIAAILTPEQRAEAAELRAKKLEKRKARAERVMERHDG